MGRLAVVGFGGRVPPTGAASSVVILLCLDDQAILECQVRVDVAEPLPSLYHGRVRCVDARPWSPSIVKFVALDILLRLGTRETVRRVALTVWMDLDIFFLQDPVQTLCDHLRHGAEVIAPEQSDWYGQLHDALLVAVPKPHVADLFTALLTYIHEYPMAGRDPARTLDAFLTSAKPLSQYGKCDPLHLD